MVFLLEIIYYLLTIYFYMLIVYILLSWLPELQQSRVYQVLHQFADPYMRIFRGFLVFGQFDFTPIIGFLLFRIGLTALGQFIQAM